ncbi:hypothetical protein FH689_10645, partial [Streptococcus suis]|uniref:hypothetical protein n=1 Tax=Streptococcus suis TaxID=1307 RepID=UPI001147574F
MVDAEAEARMAKKRAEYESEQAARRAASDAEIADYPMSMAMPDGIEKWAQCEAVNAGSDYSMAVLHYAERWARTMEARMATGQPLDAVARQASFDADVEGITGFQHGCAVSILSECWKHGGGLRAADRQ